MPRPVSDSIYVVIMAGGSGTRFWPLSRRQRPKQLLSLVTQRSLLVETIARVAPSMVGFERVLIVTGEHLAGPTKEVIGSLGCRLVLEPMPRNTAPCLALAASVVAEEDPTAVMAVLPADQFIEDVEGYRYVFEQAAQVASTGRIATLGIRPTHAETGYGYIKRAEACGDGVFNIEAFVEKPNRPTAERYLEDGRYDWNSGMFFMRADTLLKAVDDHMPGLSAGIADYRAARGTADESAALVRCFEAAEPISIDYGVMEKEARNIAVIPASIGWSDVGSWRTIYDFRPEENPNFVRGDVTVVDTADSVIVSDGPHVAVIGLQGMAVIATGDAVLVAPLSRAQEVGAVAKGLAAGGRTELT